MANEAANNDGKSYTLGPIIHNPQVVGRLEDKGVSLFKKCLISMKAQ